MVDALLFRLGLIAVSALVLVWLSPVGAALVFVAVALGWGLGRSGRAGRAAVVVAMLVLMALSRVLDSAVGTLGLGALTLQMLVWLNEDAPEQVSPVDYVLTLIFLPRALGGPVWERTRRDLGRPDPSGLLLVMLGAFEKLVIADTFAGFADAAFDTHGPIGLVDAWTGLVAFAVQALFGLAGLWHLAQGLGRLAGLELPPGPDRPFSAPDLAGFWTRWHPSLARVLRDCVWAPLRKYGSGVAALGVAGLALCWHAIHPMLALAAGLQLAWLGIARVLPVPPARPLVWLAVLHGLMVARSPDLERAAFVQDGLIGVFGLGGARPATLLAGVAGVMLLGLGPPGPGGPLGRIGFVGRLGSPGGARGSSLQGTDGILAALLLGVGLAACILWASGARPFLYARF